MAIKLKQTFLSAPVIEKYAVKRDKNFVGYKVQIRWNYEDKNIVGFKVYKARLTKPLLQKKYVINQNALESLTRVKSFPVKSNVLFNKSLFTQNSKVKLEIFGDHIETKQEKPISKFEYSEVGFVVKNKIKKYEFSDKNIKFGETYAYIVVAVGSSLRESNKSMPVFVNIEDIEHPSAPQNLTLTAMPDGNLLIIKTANDNDIFAFDIYRREISEKNFQLVERLPCNTTFISFLDSQVQAGKTYEYKVYSVDFFQNVSFSGVFGRVYFGSSLSRQRGLPSPEFELLVEPPYVKIIGYKNHPDLLGYKIERKDTWRFEKSFNIKKSNEISWPNVLIFDKDDKIELLDNTANFGRRYSYRITSISKNHFPCTYSFVPPFVVIAGYTFSSINHKKELPIDPVEIIDFHADVIDRKQDPVYVKFSWKINGEWSYLKIASETFSLVVDDIHQFAITNELKPGVHNLKLAAFDEKGQELANLSEVQITV